MAPCITIIVWNQTSQTAVLCHVDKIQDPVLTINALFDRVTGTPTDPVRVYFHGGNCNTTMEFENPNTGRKEYTSWTTATGLLNAILQRGDTDCIRIVAFDVLARPHGQAVAFDTRDGSVLPDVGERSLKLLDTNFRLIQVQPQFSQVCFVL
jgi:hypothetical protein